MFDPGLLKSVAAEAGADVVAVLAPPSDNDGIDGVADDAGVDPNKLELC